MILDNFHYDYNSNDGLMRSMCFFFKKKDIFLKRDEWANNLNEYARPIENILIEYYGSLNHKISEEVGANFNDPEVRTRYELIGGFLSNFSSPFKVTSTLSKTIKFASSFLDEQENNNTLDARTSLYISPEFFRTSSKTQKHMKDIFNMLIEADFYEATEKSTKTLGLVDELLNKGLVGSEYQKRILDLSLGDKFNNKSYLNL